MSLLSLWVDGICLDRVDGAKGEQQADAALVMNCSLPQVCVAHLPNDTSDVRFWDEGASIGQNFGTTGN